MHSFGESGSSSVETCGQHAYTGLKTCWSVSVSIGGSLGWPQPGFVRADQDARQQCRLVHGACLTSVPSTLPRPVPRCERSDCYLGHRIPFLVCFLLPLSSHFFECPFLGRLDLLPKKCNYQKSTPLTHFCPKQLLPTGEFHIVLRKSATNTNNNKICLYFLDDFFHPGLPSESRALS